MIHPFTYNVYASTSDTWEVYTLLHDLRSRLISIDTTILPPAPLLPVMIIDFDTNPTITP